MAGGCLSSRPRTARRFEKFYDGRRALGNTEPTHGVGVGAYWQIVSELRAPRDSCQGDTTFVMDDWADVLRVLVEVDARFLVVGAHALAVHGVPRATRDLDVWVEPSEANAERVWDALVRFGAPLKDLGIRREDFSTSGTVVQLGLPPQRIDFLTDISGVPDFDAAYARRVMRTIAECEVPFIGRAELIDNKRATGRLKDQADVEALGEGV